MTVRDGGSYVIDKKGNEKLVHQTADVPMPSIAEPEKPEYSEAAQPMNTSTEGTNA